MKRQYLVVGILTVVLTAASGARADERAANDSQSWFETLDGANKDLARDSGELKRATQGLKRSPLPEPTRGLGPRTAAVMRDGLPQVVAVATTRALPGKRKACAAQPRLEYFVAGDLPYPAEPFTVCMRLSRGGQRFVHVRARIVTGRGREVGKIDAVVDFADQATVEHRADYGTVKLPEHGTYRYIVDIDGVRAFNSPLFQVRPVVQPD